MRALIALALALAAPMAAGAAQAQPAARAATAQDWTRRVEVTAEGGYRMGNPNAARKLVEYGSITCSHCADFDREAGPAIREAVRSGRVSFEYRPYLIFPSDPGIFALMGCQAPGRFFDSLHALYANQSEWIAKLRAREAQTRTEIQGRPLGAAMLAIVRASGTDAHFRANGMTDRQMTTCLGDRARFDRLEATSRQGQALGVDGTPTFFLNGAKLNVASFADVVAALRRP